MKLGRTKALGNSHQFTICKQRSSKISTSNIIYGNNNISQRRSYPLNVWGNFGNACLRISDREEQGREALSRAVGLMQDRLARNVGSPEEWSRLAEWYSALDRHAEALAAIDRAVAIAPDVQTMVRAAWVHLKRGDAAAAVQWLEQAVASGYSMQELLRHPQLGALQGRQDFQRLLDAQQRGARKNTAHRNTQQQEAE